jgi:hypothetical protein
MFVVNLNVKNVCRAIKPSKAKSVLEQQIQKIKDFRVKFSKLKCKKEIFFRAAVPRMRTFPWSATSRLKSKAATNPIGAESREQQKMWKQKFLKVVLKYLYSLNFFLS